MPGQICTMPQCYNEQEYMTIGVCRKCYHRIYWVSRNYLKTIAKAKAALMELDAVAIKHGLQTVEDGPYSRKKNLTS